MSETKNKSLRIVFIGTPEFAVESLRHLLGAQLNLVGVVTAPDRPAGRGRKIQESAVKKFAVANGIRVLQPLKLRDESFLEQLRELNANLQVVVAFRMLPRAVWEMPEYGTFNLHASLLPQYRGAAPINWALMNGETETGVTTFFIDDKIDTGHMILQTKEAITPGDNAGSLHDRLMSIGGRLVVETCTLIAQGDVETHPQKQSDLLKPAPKINKETCRIDWSKPMDQIQNHIRGLSPYPGAWSFLKKSAQAEMTQLKIFKSRFEIQNHSFTTGSIIHSKKTMKVAVQNGFIVLLEIQFPGKKRMNVKETLHGQNLGENAEMR
ncbi:MAG: methionyl-tRNA formyltransferase [Bacteroidota bacterium]